MSHIGLADLLGVRTKSIQWERPLLFFAALFCSDWVWLVIYPIFYWLMGNTYSRFSIGSAPNWANTFLVDLLLALLAVMAFRWLPYAILAILATALGYGLLSNPISNIVFNGSIRFWDLQATLTSALWPMLLLGGLELAARWLKPLWLALLTGSVAGSLASFASLLIINRFTLEANQVSEFTSLIVKRLPFRLLDAAIFAVVLWVGWLLTAGKDSSAEFKEPRLTKGFYLGAVIASVGASLIMIASILFSITFGGRSSRSDMDQAFTSILFAGLIGMFGSIVFLVLTYRMWAAIQDGHARTTPGRAVGMLFIPFYNFYWIFQVYRGFAEDFNSFSFRHSINTPLLPTGLFTAYGVLTILGALPFFGWLLVAINFFVMLAMISKICDAVNSIPEKLPDQDSGGPAFHVL